MFDEGIKYDGFTMAEWNQALCDFCNGPRIFDSLGGKKDVRSELIRLMFERAQERLEMEGKIGKQVIVGDVVAKPKKTIPDHIMPIFLEQRKQWQTFWDNAGFRNFDILKVRIPVYQEGFDRLIVMARKINPEVAYEICAKMFPCLKVTLGDLNRLSMTESRTAKDNAYAIWVRDRAEPDEDLKFNSAEDLERKKIVCMTLTERLIFAAEHFYRTRRHLDREGYTLCVGSFVGEEKQIPIVDWRGGKEMYIALCYFSTKGISKCARRVIAV